MGLGSRSGSGPMASASTWVRGRVRGRVGGRVGARVKVMAGADGVGLHLVHQQQHRLDRRLVARHGHGHLVRGRVRVRVRVRGWGQG